MVEISRKLAKQIRVVLGRCLSDSARGPFPAVEFEANRRGLTVRSQSRQAAIEYQQAGSYADQHFALPFDVLKQCEGNKPDAIQFEVHDTSIAAKWNDAGIPQLVTVDAADLAGDFPAIPSEMRANEPRLLAALRDAVQTADTDAVRYALNCLQLHGQRGRIAATDGRQLLVQDGFDFPWDEGLLVPARNVFASRELSDTETVEIGRTADWVGIRVGPWTIFLKIETEGRFPAVEDNIPVAEAAVANLAIAEPDSRFLLEAVKRLPSHDDWSKPVTVDLNGSVAVRAQGEGQPTPTELVLSNSRPDGEAIRFHTNRTYLARALRLGFRRLQLSGPDAPVCCRDEQRAYVWALLSKDGVIKPDDQATRIASPAASSDTGSSNTKPRNRSRRTTTTMPQANRTNKTDHPDGPASLESSATTTLVEDTEALRDTLQQALTQTRNLLAALKRQKKQSRLVQTTINSLRQLQTIDA